MSHPAEPAEREADEVADRVMLMRNGDATVHIGPASRPSVRRHAEDAAATLQAGPDTGLAAGIARHARGGGQALDAGARQFMEARFGRGLGDVKVHADAAAGRLARQVDSYAFTVGRHIFFAPGRYRPGDHDGRHVLAHELTHVVQQDAVGPAPAVRRQARPGGQPGAGPAPAEKVSGTLESAYRRLGDTRRAAAIRMCREHGGGACSIVLTQAEARQLYELAQQSGGDEQKIRAGLPAAAPAALGVVPAASGLTVGMLTPGLPPAAPVPPFLAPPVPTPPVGVPGYPTWAPPPPVATAPAAEVAVGEIAGTEAVGATVSVAAVSAVAVAALVVACALVVYEAWQFSKFQRELEAKGFIILDDALAVCTHGCHATAQPIRPLPDLDMPFRPLPEFPFPGRPFPLPGERLPWPDIEIGGPKRRPPEPDEEREEPGDRRKERPRDRRRRSDKGPDVDIDPRPDEPRERPKDPCDRSLFHPCDGGLTFDQAYQIVSRLPGFPSARSSGREPVRDGACWVDGRPRTRDLALADGATHQTWNLPNGDKLATIKCCRCCIRGGTGAIGMHCTIN